MNNLITIEINEQMEQTVSCRELHEKLGIEKHFTQWWEQQVNRMRLVEGKDFLTLRLESTGGRPSVDYRVNLDTAKHLCMMSGGEKAFEIRDYFIQTEKAWNDPELVMARSLQYANHKLIGYSDTIKMLETKIESDRPAVEFFNVAVDRNGLTSIRDTAYEIGCRQTDLVNVMLAKRWIYRSTKNRIKPHSEFAQSGRGFLEYKDFEAKNGFAGGQTMVTIKGKAAILEIMKIEGYITTTEVTICQ